MDNAEKIVIGLILGFNTAMMIGIVIAVFKIYWLLRQHATTSTSAGGG